MSKRPPSADAVEKSKRQKSETGQKFLSFQGYPDRFLELEQMHDGREVGRAFFGDLGAVLRGGKLCEVPQSTEFQFRRKNASGDYETINARYGRILLTLFDPRPDMGELEAIRNKDIPLSAGLAAFRWGTPKERAQNTESKNHRSLTACAGKKELAFKHASEAGTYFNVDPNTIRDHAKGKRAKGLLFEGERWSFEYDEESQYAEAIFDHRTDGFKTIEKAPKYEVHRDMTVRHRESHQVRKPIMNAQGYMTFNLYVGNKPVHFHRNVIMAEAFVTNDDPENKIEVDHKNLIRDDDRPENLEWVTSQENVTRAKYSSGRTRPCLQVDKDGQPIYLWKTQAEAQRVLGIEGQLAAHLCNPEKRKTAGGYRFRYLQADDTFTAAQNVPNPQDYSDRLRSEPKKVAQFDLDGKFLQVFANPSQAGNSLGPKSRSAVARALKKSKTGKVKCKGFLWIFVTEAMEQQYEQTGRISLD